jgi:hypothetical protein
VTKRVKLDGLGGDLTAPSCAGAINIVTGLREPTSSGQNQTRAKRLPRCRTWTMLCGRAESITTCRSCGSGSAGRAKVLNLKLWSGAAGGERRAEPWRRSSRGGKAAETPLSLTPAPSATRPGPLVREHAPRA